MESSRIHSPNNAAIETDAPFVADDISTDKPFIQANTIASTLEDLCEHHIIPVFIKDNEPLISHSDFIQTMINAVQDYYQNDTYSLLSNQAVSNLHRLTFIYVPKMGLSRYPFIVPSGFI